MPVNTLEILTTAVARKASDIHILVNQAPMIRVSGHIMPMEGAPVFTAADTHRFIYSLLTEDHRRKFEEHLEFDGSFTAPGVARFRVNVLMTRQGIEAVMRVLSASIPTTATLGFTPAMEDLAKLPRGLVLITGPTGSGKTTTLAALIDRINSTRHEHILTIEDPIEYLYESKNCIVRQREVGTTTKSFANALRAALREDPDIILVGELRDLETISLALTAGETGHLVFATLHTTDAPQTIDRIIDVFPPHQQSQVRAQLSSCLRAVISQTLVPILDGGGRIAAREMMFVTPAISNLIRESKMAMIYNAMETGARQGMMTLDKSLEDLVKARKISLAEALIKARDPAKVETACKGFD